jgi:hypothetical protein
LISFLAEVSNHRDDIALVKKWAEGFGRARLRAAESVARDAIQRMKDGEWPKNQGLDAWNLLQSLYALEKQLGWRSANSNVALFIRQLASQATPNPRIHKWKPTSCTGSKQVHRLQSCLSPLLIRRVSCVDFELATI